MTAATERTGSVNTPKRTLLLSPPLKKTARYSIQPKCDEHRGSFPRVSSSGQAAHPLRPAWNIGRYGDDLIVVRIITHDVQR